MRAHLILLTALLSQSVSTGHADAKPAVALWANERLFVAPGNYTIEEHPCGGVVVVHVSIMPALDQKADLNPEQVTELSATGRRLRTWRTPVDTWPVAVKGSKLLVQDNRSAYWVSTSGRISTATIDLSPVVQPSPQSCPRAKSNPIDPLASCVSLNDQASGKIRVIAFSGVCS